MKKKGFLEIPFGWLFALIVGMFILFLAIYLSIKLINTENTAQNAELAKGIGILTDPLETGFEEGSVSNLNLATNTRIYNKCEDYGTFGRQIISTSQQSFGKWTEIGVDVSFYNKYLFSENYIEGKNFYIFSKPFEFPFKIADLIYIIPSGQQYCFVEAPNDISKEISDLGLNILNVKNFNNCPKTSVKVCFDSSGCDILVKINEKSVTKQSEKVFYINNALMYAAIFSDKEIYECQLKRLMERTSVLSSIYDQKAILVSQKNCRTNIDLTGLNNLASSFNNSIDIRAMGSLVDDLNQKYGAEECKLW